MQFTVNPIYSVKYTVARRGFYVKSRVRARCDHVTCIWVWFAFDYYSRFDRFMYKYKSWSSNSFCISPSFLLWRLISMFLSCQTRSILRYTCVYHRMIVFYLVCCAYIFALTIDDKQHICTVTNIYSSACIHVMGRIERLILTCIWRQMHSIHQHRFDIDFRALKSTWMICPVSHF